MEQTWDATSFPWRRVVSIPPTIFDLQSLTIMAISKQAPLIFSSLAARVSAAGSDRPRDDNICPSHLNLSTSWSQTVHTSEAEPPELALLGFLM